MSWFNGQCLPFLGMDKVTRPSQSEAARAPVCVSHKESCPTLCDPVDYSPLICPWGFSRQESWSGLPRPPPGALPDPGMEPVLCLCTCRRALEQRLGSPRGASINETGRCCRSAFSALRRGHTLPCFHDPMLAPTRSLRPVGFSSVCSGEPGAERRLANRRS